MIEISVKDLQKILNCEVINYREIKIKGVERDSRAIEKDNLFAPIRGNNFDGHSFIEQVISKGIKVSLWQKDVKPYPSEITLLVVEDVLEALQKLAKEYVRMIGAKVVAITGSNGKTSIKDMCASILAQSHNVTKTYKNYNNDLGLCLSIFRANLSDEFLVLEMGMDNIGDIERLVKIVDIDVAIISNIGSAHLEFLKTRKNIAKAKLEILGGIKRDGLFIKPHDESLLEYEFENIKTFGVEFGDIYAKNISIDYNGVKFDTNIIKSIKINSFGIVQVLNALPVILACKHLGIDDEDIKNGIASVDFTERRNMIYKSGDVYIYDDSYKSNPEGLYKCFETMNYFQERKIAVLSDMLELGKDEVRFHIDVARKAKLYNIDEIYLYGELSKFTYEECKKLNIDAHFYENKLDMIKDLKKINEGIILFKASNAQKINEVIEVFINVK